MTNSFKTYYVSQIDGNDTNDGLSKSSAFATLFAINRLTLKPGDRVLLARGSVFEGQFLQIKDSGTKESPIEIGAYLSESGEILSAHIEDTSVGYKNMARKTVPLFPAYAWILYSHLKKSNSWVFVHPLHGKKD